MQCRLTARLVYRFECFPNWREQRAVSVTRAPFFNNSQSVDGAGSGSCFGLSSRINPHSNFIQVARNSFLGALAVV